MDNLLRKRGELLGLTIPSRILSFLFVMLGGSFRKVLSVCLFLCPFSAIWGELPFVNVNEVPVEIEQFEMGEEVYYLFTLSRDGETRPSIFYGGNAGFMADRIVYNDYSKQITATGNVRVTLGPQELFGDHLEYDTEMGRGMLTDADLRSNEVSVEGGKIEIREIRVRTRDQVEEVYNFEVVDGSVTTCEYTIPHYHVNAEFLRIIPKIRVWLYSAVYRVTGVPLFYLPFITRSLRKEPFAYVFEPGFEDEKGFIVLNRFHFHYQDVLHPVARGTVFADVFTQQGVGVGAKWNYLRQPEADSYLHGYWIDQQDDLDEDDVDARVRTEGSRGKIAFQHFQRLNEEWTLTAKGRRLSDPDFDEDYREEELTRGFDSDELRSDRDAFVNLARRRTNSNFRVIHKERLEDFNLLEFPEDERSEVVYDSKRRPIEGTDFFHRVRFSAGQYKSHQTTDIANIERIRPPDAPERLDADIEQEFERVDLFAELNRPFPFEWFTLVPFLGYEGTGYTDATRKTRVWTHRGENPREVLFEEYDGLLRNVGSGGVELTTRRMWDFSDPEKEIERRLLVEPTITGLVRVPDDDLEDFHPDRMKWRRVVPGSRQIRFSRELSKIDRPGFPIIDEIDQIRDEFAGFELRLESRLQSRKPGGPARDVLRGAVSTAVDFTETERGEEEFSTVFAELFFSPVEWLHYSGFLEYEPEGSFVRSSRNALRWQPADPFSIEVAYSSFRFDESVQDEEELAVIIDLKLSPRYTLSYEERYDIDDSRTRLRKLGIVRDFHDWILNVGIRQTQRESRDRGFGTFVTLTFKTPRSIQERLPIENAIRGDEQEGVLPPRL